MTKLNFISSDVRKLVILKVGNAKVSLESAKSKASSLDVPDFSYSGYLNGLPGKLTDNTKTCTTDESWLEDSIKNFQTFNDDCIASIAKCESREILDKDFHINLIEK